MHTPSVRAQIITRRTYARPLDEAGTRFERWDETIDRVIGHQRWLWERAQEGPLTYAQADELADLRDIMLDRKALLAGRTLWLGGTEIARKRESSNFNCLTRDTKFITSKGVKSFEDFEDGDQVVVWTHRGRWRPAAVRNYGERNVSTVTVNRRTSVQKVRATTDHRWILKDKSETTNLGVGDHICRPTTQFNSWSYDDAPPDERLYWAYGFVYGDGTLCRNGSKPYSHSMVRLCGEKAKYEYRYEELGFKTSRPLSCGGDPFAYTGTYLKTLPDLNVDDIRIVRAFVRGYLDADGAKNVNYPKTAENPFTSIQATGQEAQDFIRTAFPSVGVFVTREEEIDLSTGYGDQRSDVTIRFGLSSGFGESSNTGYKVESIEPWGMADTWCLEVEDDHSFVLPNGIVTGNCAGSKISSVHDLVDITWLLLQGAGTGFKPVNGTLSGFSRQMAVEVVRSTRTARGGKEENVETFDRETGLWTISVGDSAEAWAKSSGKLVVGRYPAKKLVIDLSQIRPAGSRLRGYGWICSGDEKLAKAYEAIAAIRNRAAGKFLSKIDLLDITNWLGTILSSRRSAQSALMDYGDPELEAFATAKAPGFWEKNPQRAQSNNGIMFWEKPATREIKRLFDMMVAHGGAEPSFNNAAAARRRAPWFEIFNPCFEIALANRGFCNLCNTNVARFRNDERGLHRAIWLMARANYRQTLVNLRDGILQSSWHENNESLRLCGVSLTGLTQRPDIGHYQLKQIRNTATAGAYSMADELGLERPKNITSFQPAGTLGKIMDATEGAHKPLGRYIFNNVGFSRHDPLVERLTDAGYEVREHPTESDGVLIKIPISWPTVPFEVSPQGVPVNMESAISQLERYRMLQESFVDQNTSITVSYDPSEVKDMVKWFDKHWDSYVGVSFLFRNDPTKTAKELSFAYLPQEVTTQEKFEAYTKHLKPIDLESSEGIVSEIEDDCATGACPVR